MTVVGASKDINLRLDLPRQYIPKYDQGAEGACTGFAWSWAMSILNRRFYAARKLYLEAQFYDEWHDTPPEEGSSIHAVAHVLTTQGHWRFARGVTFALALMEGIKGITTALTVDDVRLAIAQKKPVVLGIPWYSAFDAPEWTDPGKGGSRWWIGRALQNLGRVRGWHAVCLFGVRDDIDAGVIVNNWGVNYPIVQMPYDTLDLVLRQSGGGLVPIDR
jgi:hypothetical protein